MYPRFFGRASNSNLLIQLCMGEMKGKQLFSSEKSASTIARNSPNELAISENANGNITLRIHAKPGAKKSCVTEIGENEMSIAIGAAPRDGAANEELISYLMSVLTLRKNEIQFDKGAKSRSKIVVISTSRLTINDVRKRLEEEIAS